MTDYLDALSTDDVLSDALSTDDVLSDALSTDNVLSDALSTDTSVLILIDPVLCNL